jgi:predicted DNA-binding transcriptional regulator YafY
MGLSRFRSKAHPERNYSDLYGQVIFVYENWRGVIERRRVTPIEIVFGEDDHHDEAQWFLRAYCHDRQAERMFAIEDIVGAIRHVRRRNNSARREVRDSNSKLTKSVPRAKMIEYKEDKDT